MSPEIMVESENIKENKEFEEEDDENETLNSDYDEDSEDQEDDITQTQDETDSVANTDTQEKKKRGRKCKPKDENADAEKVQKKRGRKPKVKEVEDNEKIPKKRGRKPKEKIYSVKELPKTFFEENKNETFILHLPIQLSDIDKNLPQPSLNNDNYSIYNEDLNNYKVNDNNLLPTQHNLMDNLVFDTDVEHDTEYNNTISMFKKKDMKDKELKEREKEFREKDKDLDDDENKGNKVIKKNLRNIMYEFINANNDKVWPEKTNIYCWWCCHQFTCTPCALPEYYKNNKFYVSGCYCSFNCAASYNFSKNDDNMWERYTLLNLMYKKMFNKKFTKISLAPPREVLKIFGGYLSIEEFRESCLKNDKVYAVIKPPLISIIPKIEENIATLNKNLKNNTPIINENILNKTQTNLKLKRNKPVTNPNSTLQSFMDLKVI